MTVTDGQVSVLNASTGAGRGSIEAFRERFGRAILGIDMLPLDDEPLRCEMTLRAIPDLAVATGALSPMRNEHRAALAGNDDFVLVLMTAGTGELRARGRVVTVRSGEAVLSANGEAATFIGHTPTRLTNIRLNRHLLTRLVDEPDAMVARVLPTTGLPLRLLGEYASVLGDPGVTLEAAMRRVVATNMHELAALALGAVAPRQRSGGVKAARLRAIKRDMGREFWRPDLGILEMARRHGISPSYLRQLFAAEGRTFAEHLLELRLDEARRRLTASEEGISGIAFALGFGDLSYFNRSFRRRFGMTPSDMRANRLP